MNKYSLIILALAVTTWTACGNSSTNDQNHDHMMNDSTHMHSNEKGHEHMMNDSTHNMSGSTGTNSSEALAYACPMHPEVTGKDGDKCSKCGMYLEPID